MRKGTFEKDGSMNQFIMTASSILSTKFNVVVILVSVYNHKHNKHICDRPRQNHIAAKMIFELRRPLPKSTFELRLEKI